MNIQEALYLFEYVCWILASVAVAYPLIYSLASLGTRKSYYPTAHKQHKFVVLFPAYKEDRVIIPVVESFLQQHYPQELYNVVVISDHMQDSTNKRLAQLPITLLRANYENSSKAKALNFAMDHFGRDEFDAVVILDADNVVDSNFLTEINKVFDAGVQAIQAHRTAKNRNTDIAVLDGLSEEVNNSIFRRGHVRLGISSALIGSGMIFNYPWFHDNVKHLVTTGEDKELEVLLLKQRIFIEFLDEVYVYDEKTQGEKGFYNQRRRWLATQFAQWGRVFRDLPRAILPGQPVCSIHGCDLFFAVLEWFREQQNPSRVYSCEKCVVLQWLFSWMYFYNVEDPFFFVFTNFLFIPFIRNKLTTIMTNNKGSLLIDFLN